jgi:hypothetical protein
MVVEAIDPNTKKQMSYESETFRYPCNFRKTRFTSFKKNKKEFDDYIKKVVTIGDTAEVIISEKNPKIYYIPEPTKKT